MFQNLNTYIFVIGIVLFAVLALTNLLAIALLLAFAFILSFFIQRFGLRMIGIELVTFVSVVAGFVYGPFVGITIALVLIIFHLLVSGYFGIYFAWVIPEYPIAAYIASTMTGQGIISVGILIVIGLNVINIFLTAIAYRQNIGKYFLYAVTNVLLNVILFMAAGQLVVDILR